MNERILVPLVGGCTLAVGCWMVMALFLVLLKWAGADLGSPFGWPIWASLAIGAIGALILWAIGIALEGIG